MELIYYYEVYRRQNNPGRAWGGQELDFAPTAELRNRSLRTDNTTAIGKRVESDYVLQTTPYWELSQISTPPGMQWYRNPRFHWLAESQRMHVYNHYQHESSGAGQYVYILEDGIWDDHQAS